jgi:hypothetical protein
MYTYIYNTYVFEYIQRDAEQWRGRSSGVGGAALCRRGNLTPVCRRQTTMKTTRLRSSSSSSTLMTPKQAAVETGDGTYARVHTVLIPMYSMHRLFIPGRSTRCNILNSIHIRMVYQVVSVVQMYEDVRRTVIEYYMR